MSVNISVKSPFTKLLRDRPRAQRTMASCAQEGREIRAMRLEDREVLWKQSLVGMTEHRWGRASDPLGRGGALKASWPAHPLLRRPQWRSQTLALSGPH